MAKKSGRRAHKKQTPQSKTIQNRRARHDYTLGDSLVVGMALSGMEAKSLRLGHGQLQGAYVAVKDSELYLIGATIHGTTGIPIGDDGKDRTRKLLARRREIDALIAAKSQGRTIVPLEILTRGRFIKLRIAVGTGKKRYDKREALKRKDQERTVRREIKIG